MNNEIKQCFLLLKSYKYKLNKQQYKTFKGQIISGDYDGYFFEHPISKDSNGGYQAHICTEKNSFNCINIIFLNK